MTEPRPVIVWLWNKLKTREWQTYLTIVHSLSVLGKGLHDNRNVFTPHIYCFEHWTEWKVFSQAFHGAGHKCISRECFNWMRISQHLHRADTDKYIRPGARGISGDIFIRCGPHSLRGHAGPVTYAGQSVSTSWFWFPEFVFAPRKYLPSLW